MKTKEQLKLELSDNFLKEVISVLQLGDFRFVKKNMNTNVKICDNVKIKLKKLCKENKDERIRYNEFYKPNSTMNINWSYQVMM